MPSKFNKTSTKANYNRLTDSSTLTNFLTDKNRELQWYDFPFTIMCTAFLVIIHFVFWFSQPVNLWFSDIFFTIPEKYVVQYAQYNPYIIHDFATQWYRLFTSIFIHENIIHLGGNLLFFVIFSLRLEELKGWKVVTIVFLISGLAGNILTILIFWDANLISLGASGAVNGVFMANLVTMRKSYDKGSLTMLAFLVIFASFTIAGSNSNFFAHFGGLIGGALCMYAFEKLEKTKKFPYLFR